METAIDIGEGSLKMHPPPASRRPSEKLRGEIYILHIGENSDGDTLLFGGYFYGRMERCIK